MSNVRIFEDKNIRARWDDDDECWYFIVQDVIAFLTDSKQPSKYWSAMKARVLDSEGVELSTNCRQLKFEAADGKKYKYECANNETLFRIIQSVPSPKAEPFKKWLAQLGKERIEEIEQPQKAIDRAINYYTTKGRSKEWVSNRIQGKVARNDLTEYWRDSEVKDVEYGILTNQIYNSTFGATANQIRYVKSLSKKDSIRDNMNGLELIVTAFAEQSSLEIAKSNNAKGLKENSEAIKIAGAIVNKAVKEIEEKTNKPILSKENNKSKDTDEKTKEIIKNETEGKVIEGKKETTFDQTLKGILSVPKPPKEEK